MELRLPNQFYQIIPYSTKLWQEKTLVELELQENWWRKLWWLAEAKPIQYLSSQDLTMFWLIKLWQIGNESPNPPKFSPVKVLCYTVYWTLHYIAIYCILHGRIKGCNSSITAMMCQVRRWLYNCGRVVIGC